MEKETPYWEEDKNKKNSVYLSLFIGKLCSISLKKNIYIPELEVYRLGNLKATIIGFDDFYLYIKVSKNNKNYTALLDKSNIGSILFEQN